jgi:hypothetical protein
VTRALIRLSLRGIVRHEALELDVGADWTPVSTDRSDTVLIVSAGMLALAILELKALRAVPRTRRTVFSTLGSECLLASAIGLGVQ